MPDDRVMGADKVANSKFDLRVRKILGLTLRATGALGIGICIVGLISLPFLVPRISASVSGLVESAEAEARALAGMLGATGEAVEQAAVSLQESAEVINAAGLAITAVKPFVTSTSDFLKIDAPETITGARDALLAATTGARAIDRVLRVLSLLGPLTGVRYDEEHPLDEGLASVAESLKPLPNDLRVLGAKLVPISVDLAEVGSLMDNLTGDVDALSASLMRVERELSEQVLLMEKVATGLEQAQARIGRWISLGAVGVAFILLWTALGQYSVYIVGLQMSHEQGSGLDGSDAPAS